jgi:hypothetical protein
MERRFERGFERCFQIVTRAFARECSYNVLARRRRRR